MSEYVLKTLARRGLHVGPSKVIFGVDLNLPYAEVYGERGEWSGARRPPQ